MSNDDVEDVLRVLGEIQESADDIARGLWSAEAPLAGVSQALHRIVPILEDIAASLRRISERSDP